MPFVIIASPRTGSTHLVQQLDGQKGVACYGELLQDRLKKPLKEWRTRASLKESVSRLEALREHDPKQLVQRLFAGTPGRRHVGFKIFPNHNRDVLAELLADREVRKVILFRRNLLAVFSSSKIAKRIGERHLDTAREKQPTITFEPKEFIKFSKKYLKFYKDVIDKLNADRQDFFFLYHEEINTRPIFTNLVGFIGGDPREVALGSKIIRQNSSELLDRFSNPRLVRNFLRRRGLMHWTYEREMDFDLFAPKKATKAEPADTTTAAPALVNRTEAPTKKGKNKTPTKKGKNRAPTKKGKNTV